MNFKSLFAILVLIGFSVLSMGCIQQGAVEYLITFHASWSEETHPDNFPPDPHFSGLIGASHNDNISFWTVGDIASPGIKSMAETGSKSPLNEEITTSILNRNAFDFISGGGIGSSPGSINVTFQVSEEYPLVTIVTMIAPSPDWFVGVDSLNLMENGSFVDKKIVTLYAYDAGTDSGSSYTSDDMPTTPQDVIFLIDGYPFKYGDELVPIGSFVFNRR